MKGLIRWLDGNLALLGVWFLFVGLFLVGLEAVRAASSISAIDGAAGGATLSVPALILLAMAGFSEALVYNGVWMIAMGVLLKRWRVTLVGFEDAVSADIKVDGPDDQNVVWIGRTYATTLDARLAFDALARRIRTAGAERDEIAVSRTG